MDDNNFLEQLTVLKDCQSKRISSWDRTGGNRDWITISAHDKAILADIKGPGCIRHIYATLFSLDRFYYRNLIIRIYWDEEKKSSVEVPLGDFFGIGHCKVRYFASLLLTVNPGALSISTDGLNCYFPMPFSKRCIIEVTNESDFKLDHLWYHIDYEEYDKPEQNLARFHAQWRRENPCRPVLPEARKELTSENQTGDIGKNLTGKENYVILEAEGKELLEKEKRINEIVQKKGGALFWAKYSGEERKQITSLRGEINQAFNKEEYQKASHIWGDILEIVRIKVG